MGVALRLRGKKRGERFDSLYGEKIAIEKEIGQPLTWQSETQNAVSQIACMRLNVKPLDESQWPQHSAWFADTLSRFCTSFLKRIPGKAKRNGEKELSQTQQTFLDYWSEFHRFVVEHGPMKPHKARPQHWMPFKLGRSQFALNAMISAKQQHIQVSVTCHGTKAKARFFELSRQKAEIESEIGEPLDWEELPKRQESRITLRKQDVDPFDRSDWPDQHKWLARHLQPLFDTFSPRIRDLD